MPPLCDEIVVATVCFMHYSLANSRTSERRERFSIIHCVYCCHGKWIYSGCINSLLLQYETTSIYHHTGLHQTKYLLVPQNVLKLLLNFGKPELTLFVTYVTQTEKGVIGGFCLSHCQEKMTSPKTYIHTHTETQTHITSLIPKITIVTMSCHSPT